MGCYAIYLGLIGLERRGLTGNRKTGEVQVDGPTPGTRGRDGMKPRQIPWKWLLLGLITLLIAGLAILPRLLADSAQLASRVTDALSAWTGGEVKLTGPLRVHYFPDVSIKSGFELTNASRLPLVKSISVKDAKVSIDLVELAFGRIRIDALRMLKPEITLKEVPSLVMGPDQTVQARVANLLMIVLAQAVCPDDSFGWHTKILRRLSVSPTPCGLSGPCRSKPLTLTLCACTA